MQAAHHAIKAGSLDSTIALVLSNKKNAPALAFAKDKAIPAQHFSDDAQLTQTLKDTQPDLIFLSGYLKKIPADLLGHTIAPILNIHPSLLPKFGGKGMFGIKVHQAVLQAGEKETGATIHLVNQNYDEGKILAQSVVPVQPKDTPESLAAKVAMCETALVVQTLALIAITRQKEPHLTPLEAIEKTFA